MARQSASATPLGCSDRRALIGSLVRDSERLSSWVSGTYDVSYPEFLEYFRAAGPLTRHHLIISANFVYGWMPTILDFRSGSFVEAVALLEKARAQETLGPDELHELARLVNNSIVGASKLLHFACPSHYAIWDSRVAKYLGTSVQGGRRGVEQFAAYNACCLSLAALPEARAITGRLSSKIGYQLSPLRAIELVMFYGSLAGFTYQK